jgi:porin
VGLQAIASTHPSEYAGDLQTLSNIDAPNQRHVAEAWYSQVFGEAALLRAGVMDINSYFDVNETAAFFLNSSFGIAPTLPSNVPTATYPDSAWALMGRVGAEKNGWLLGAFQANPEGRSTALDGGAMLVVERGWSTRDTSGTRIGVGAWYRNAPLEAGPPENDWGAYANVERPFTNHPGTTAFLQFAMSPDDVNEVPAYLGGGVVFHEVSAAVSDVGFSFARAWIRHEDAETSIEATVSLPLLDAKLNLQPDIQYIVHPSGTLPNAFVAGVRLSLSLY